jgi:hypothetical protein
MALIRFVGPVHAIAVDRTRARVGQKTVPNLVGEFRQLDALDLALTSVIEQAELNLIGVCGKYCKIDPQAGPCRAPRMWPAPAQADFAHYLRRLDTEVCFHLSHLVDQI